ncbi:hypothetical protein JOD24_000531 [Kroppenstedtia sanguinis]
MAFHIPASKFYRSDPCEAQPGVLVIHILGEK